jgi:hypothetical protein
MDINDLKIGQVWRHYKGNNYKIIAIGKHSETGEAMVGYQRVEDGNVYFRPIDLFFQNIELEGKTMPRFELQS